MDATSTLIPHAEAGVEQSNFVKEGRERQGIFLELGLTGNHPPKLRYVSSENTYIRNVVVGAYIICEASLHDFVR